VQLAEIFALKLFNELATEFPALEVLFKPVAALFAADVALLAASALS
jgi:hypothetical protein